MVYLSLETTDADCLGNEPVYANGKLVGVTTSGGFGHHVAKSLAFAFVDPDNSSPGTKLSIQIMGVQQDAIVEAEPLWEPQVIRIRG